MRRYLLSLALPFLIAAAPPPEPQPVDESKTILAERDAVIQKIASGEDFERSVARFAELRKRFESLSVAQKLSSATNTDNQRLARERYYKYLRSLDFRVGEQCQMAVDPTNRPKGDSYHAFRGEHGKIVAKKTVKLPGKSGFDEEESVETFQVSAQSGLYSFGAKEMKTHDGKPFTGSIGDTVFFCYASASSHGSGSYLPPEFRDKVLGSGFVSRIKAPPRIVSKSKWNPLHLLGRGTLRMVAREGRWPLPENAIVLSHLLVEKDLGNGRFEIRLDEPHDVGRPTAVSFLLDVPTGLRGRELVGPGEWLWVIMSRPVIDKQLRKLILTAEDIEPVYVEALDEAK